MPQTKHFINSTYLSNNLLLNLFLNINQLDALSASSWLILRNKYIEMHGQQNIKTST